MRLSLWAIRSLETSFISISLYRMKKNPLTSRRLLHSMHFPQCTIVKGDIVGKTSYWICTVQISQQWNSNFALSLCTASQSTQYESFVWFHQELKKLYQLSFNGKFPLCVRGFKNRRAKLTNHKPGSNNGDVIRPIQWRVRVLPTCTLPETLFLA